VARAIKTSLVLVGLMMLTAACQGSDSTPLPTRFVAPTFPPTATYTATATFTATPSPTTTHTPTATPSATDTPTATFTPTATYTPTATPTATPVQIIVDNGIGAYVRTGPGVIYDIVGEVDANATFNALAYATDAAGDLWYLVERAPGTAVWISDQVSSRVNNADLTQIRMAVTVPPSPTPTDTLTPSLTPTPSPTATLPPGANARIYPASEVNLRDGPSLYHAIIGKLAPGAPLQLLGRNASQTWYQAFTFDGRVGWVFAELVEVYIDPIRLTITWAEPIRANPGDSALPPQAFGRARAIYESGYQVGNQANVFIMIGDSVSAGTETSLPAFYAIAHGSYNLGGYGYLQNTINFFNPSFGAVFLTSRAGFKSGDILDPTWADPSVCAPGETPLACEYRRKKPAVAIIDIGLMDLMVSTPEAYQTNLDAMVRALIDYGVIPLLTTMTASKDTAAAQGRTATIDRMNRTIRDTAARYQVPLIDFQRAAASLPNQGCVEDGYHLSYRVDGVINFTGDENVYGKDLRELMTLQMLYDIQKNVMGY
jgi:uncharacterized protein YgiM (DUF1202 family)